MSILLIVAMVVVILLFIVLMVFLLGEVVYLSSKGKQFRNFYHDKLHIHVPDENSDSISYCKVCGKKIVQYKDNWIG